MNTQELKRSHMNIKPMSNKSMKHARRKMRRERMRAMKATTSSNRPRPGTKTSGISVPHEKETETTSHPRSSHPGRPR